MIQFSVFAKKKKDPGFSAQSIKRVGTVSQWKRGRHRDLKNRALFVGARSKIIFLEKLLSVIFLTVIHKRMLAFLSNFTLRIWKM